MIKKLLLKNSERLLISELEIASSFVDRSIGLLKYKKYSEDKALWIHQCKSIHTFFMKFSIDCLFIDHEMRIKKIYTDLPPWRMTFPVFFAESVIEMKAGTVEKLGLREGDILHVES